MEKFIETTHCVSQVHCKTCRSSDKWRSEIIQLYDWDGNCPYGFTENDYPSIKQMPPVKQQIINLSEAVSRIVVALVNGDKVLADEQKRNERISICESCEFLNINRCSKCGCYTSKKIALETEKCPEGKW